MLPAPHRMRRHDDFVLSVKRGRRAGSAHLVAHLLATPHDVASPTSPTSRPRPPLVGLIVSKAVGTAVVRGRVKRRLRALLAKRVDLLPAGSLLVVRANPLAAQATSAELAVSLDRALGRLLGVVVRPS